MAAAGALCGSPLLADRDIRRLAISGNWTGDSMIKRFFAIGIALVGVFLISGVAVAGTATTLTGTSEWSSVQVPGMDAFYGINEIQGSVAGKLGRGSYSGRLTIDPTQGTPAACETRDPARGPCFYVSGTITFSTNRGDFTAVVQPASFAETLDIASTSVRWFTLTLRVVSGTRSYAHADGILKLFLTSTWIHTWVNTGDDVVFVDRVDDSGTLTGNPH